MRVQVPCSCFVHISVHDMRPPRVKLTFPTLAVDINVIIDPKFSVVLYSFYCNSNISIVSILLCGCGNVTVPQTTEVFSKP